MASTISFGDANSGLQAGIINGPVNAEFHPPLERPETPPHPSAVIPFVRDRDFVERGGLLDHIHQKCAVSGSRTALVGLGGVGKSQLAIEYGFRVQEQSPGTWVFWIHASSTARFEQSYRDIADHIKIFGRKDPKANISKLVHDWLRNGKYGPWLLVLDNVDDTHLPLETGGAVQGVQETGADSGIPRAISAHLPQSQNGSILITSRNKGIALKLVEEQDIIVVEPMAQAHALTLFKRKLRSLGDDKDVAELAEALEYMPLAIVQSAAYVCQKAPRYSVRQYLKDFRKSDCKKTSLLNYEGGQLRRDWEAKNSIIITWQISFEYVWQTWRSAADLLSLMSFFDRQGIPEFLVRNLFQSKGCRGSQTQLDQHSESENGEESGEYSVLDSGKDDGFEDDVQVLRNYSFISCDTDRSFTMHALVQLAMRKWLEANEQLEPWKQQYVQSLSAAFPSGQYENWVSCQALFPHVKSAVAQRPKAEGSLIAWASLMYNAAWYAWTKGNAADATQLSRRALEVRKKIFGPEHKKTLSSMGMVGLAYGLGGWWKDAEELEVQVMKTTKRLLGEEHPDTLSSVINLSSTYRNQGRWKEAEELEVQVIETMKRVLGEEHPDTLSSVANLASTYLNQERWKEAEELLKQVIKIRKKVLSEEHPDTLICVNNLASTYLNQGRWKKAEELLIQVIEIRKRVLSEEHPDALSSMVNLAFTWKWQGQNVKAFNLMGECVRLRTRILGANHPHTLSSSAAFTKWQIQEPKASSFTTNKMKNTKGEPKRSNEASDYTIHSGSKKRIRRGIKRQHSN